MNIDTQPQIIFAVVNDPSSNRYSDESKGQRTNPLIRFEPIKGLAVGFVIAYPIQYPCTVGFARVSGPI
jgi:hypothetical protein